MAIVSLRGALALALGVVLATAAAAADSARPDADAPAGVQFHKRGDGWLLADDKGMTLYTFIVDQQPGKSGCNDGCAATWPPYLAAANAVAAGDWTVIARADGKKQWAYRNKPLYAYSNDTQAGDTYGDDFAAQWSVAIKPIPVPVGVAITKTILGHVLSDAQGLTLYRLDKDMPGKSACDAICARTWIPLAAPAMARDRGDWTIVLRADGSRQWAFQKVPLYRFAGEIHAGDALGDGMGGKWHALVLEAPPARPNWVTVAGSDTGDLFADAAGRTLYMRNANNRRRPQNGVGVVGAPPESANRPCGVECADSPWSPVLAKPDDKPVGNWSIVAREDGGRQWAFKGQALYTHKLDRMPGDFNGIRSGDGKTFTCIMRSGQPMQGTGA